MKAKQSKYNIKIVSKICDIIAKDSYTIAEVCSMVGISESCYYNWQANVVEFGEAIKKAREKYDELVVREAKKSLMKKIQGYTVQEKHTVYTESKDKDDGGRNKPKIKEQKVVDKHFQPDTVAIIFALTNKAPDEYKNRQSTELTGKDGKDLLQSKSDDELDARIAELERKLKK